jgi:hypothetical protein
MDINFKDMSNEDIENLILSCQCELLARTQKPDVYTFEFSATSDPRKGTPYVAKLTWSNGELQRDFYDLDRIYGKKEVTVSGEFKAKYGDIIEQRVGGSWKNDYRDWYIVINGQLKKLANISDSSGKTTVQNYLKKKISLEELLEKIR